MGQDTRCAAHDVACLRKHLQHDKMMPLLPAQLSLKNADELKHYGEDDCNTTWNSHAISAAAAAMAAHAMAQAAGVMLRVAS
jgi:hypothetical protein